MDRLLVVNLYWDHFVSTLSFSTEPSPVTIHSVGRKAAEEVSTPIRLFEFILLNTFKTVNGQSYRTGCQTDWCCPWNPVRYFKIQLKSDPSKALMRRKYRPKTAPRTDQIYSPGISGSGKPGQSFYFWLGLANRAIIWL